MKKNLLFKILFLLLLVTSKVHAQPANYQIYPSDDGIWGNALYFGYGWKGDATEKITSGPDSPKYGPPHGLNFITNNKIRMSINHSGYIEMETRLRVAGTMVVGDSIDAQGDVLARENLKVGKNLTTDGTLEATREPVKIARLHIDPYNLSDGYSNAGIFFGGASYSESSTGIGSSINGYSGPQNGLNFWTQGNLAMAIDSNGRVGVGVNPAKVTDKGSDKYKLLVKGAIRAVNLQISNLDKWPDYVFDKNYALTSLRSLEKFVNTNKHLPNFPSAKQIENDNNSMSVSEIITSLLKTVEEQALYIIDINKKVESMQQRLDGLMSKEQ